MKKVIDYLYEIDYRPVSLIGNCEKDFEFLCLHNIEIAKALGFEAAFVTKELEKINPIKLDSVWDVEKLRKETNFNYDIFNEEVQNLVYYKSITDKPLGGGCFGPLTIALDILSADICLRMASKNPKVLESLVSYVTDYLIELARMEESSGADFFWIAEPLASLFSPESFWRFSGKFLKKIYGSIDIPGFLHVCGKTTMHTSYMAKTGAQVLSIDYMTDIQHCISVVDEDIVIMGNLNPLKLWMGTNEEIMNEVDSINYKMRNYKNFIFSSGCSVPSETPKENIELVNKLARKYPIRSADEYHLIRKLINMFFEKDENGLSKFIVNKHVDRKLFDEICTEIRIMNKYRVQLPEDLLENVIVNLKRKCYGGDLIG